MNNKIKIYFQPAFLICVLILIIANSGMSVAIKHFGLYLKKEPVLLKKPLDLLNEKVLRLYKIVSKQKIKNREILATLGTEDYIQWVLEDTTVPKSSPTRNFLLFITYYRSPDRVPHVPEECYTGGGYQKIESEGAKFNIDTPTFTKEIPVRYITFGKVGNIFGRSLVSMKFPVVYLFKVNGIYGNSREDARIELNKNIFGKSSYFSKIELVFNQSAVSPSKEESLKASQKILSIILPVLEAEYWPDWGSS